MSWDCQSLRGQRHTEAHEVTEAAESGQVDEDQVTSVPWASLRSRCISLKGPQGCL